ncbi:MAG: peroxiredoxin [Chloroflexota bacterium]
MTTLTQLPDDLPIPADDGGCDHLSGMKLPNVTLASTQGDSGNLSTLSGTTVIYIYPMTGRPDTPLPDGWEQMPGARGCTPQSCSFRDHHAELKALGATVYGLSTQTTAYQQEAAERLHLPFALLSDASLELTHALSLPTMNVEGVDSVEMTLIKRTTLICQDDVIQHVFYPVFPPDKNIEDVIAWLVNNKK